MSYFLVIRGPLGCGKTTIAKHLAKILKAEYVSIDKILAEHGLDKVSPEAECIPAENFMKANEIVLPEIKELLSDGKIVIFDACFYHKEPLEHLIKTLPLPHHVFTLKASIEVCIGRDKIRSQSHGEDAARAVHYLVSKFDFGTIIDVTKPFDEVIKKILGYLPKSKTIIVLGGGTGGLVAANELRRKTGKDIRIVLIDKNKTHVYAPSFLYLMLGKRKASKIQKPLSLLEKKGIEIVHEEIVKIDFKDRNVKTQNQNFHYDYLVISLGAELAPEKIPGLSRSGYTLYDLQGVERLRDRLKAFAIGKVAIVISSLPFKCPAAPYETAFLLDEYFQKKNTRDKIDINIFTPEPLPMPSAGPENGKIIRSMLEARNIGFNPERKLISVNRNKKELAFEDGKITNFDLLIFVPPHQGQKLIRDSGIGNETGWISVDKTTFEIRAPAPAAAGTTLDMAKYENVFAIGDGTGITLASGKSLPKAGVFAHFEAEVVAANIASKITNSPTQKKYDGRAYCFLEFGFGKAGFATGNFYAEPIPIVTMKGPGRLWHWGKILLEKYWLWKWF